jgi:hypothetical protein
MTLLLSWPTSSPSGSSATLSALLRRDEATAAWRAFTGGPSLDRRIRSARPSAAIEESWPMLKIGQIVPILRK